ncbi:MAG: sigma factor-like helix-turn-helix DNA-binding protein, partial [Alphaproteobacteria bacterium]|nr:sigma factor-like helix-turn-helix DNA-binding protein [Alphaproteobacteria bacterium]
PERAAFLLHDVFDLSFEDIANTLHKSEAACRQLATRARKAVKKPRPHSEVPKSTYENLNSQFFQTLQTGDLDGLKSLLQEEVVLYSDGGGIRSAALRLIYGADKVSRFFMGITKKFGSRADSIEICCTELNGQPSVVVFLDGELDQTFSIDIEDGLISKIYTVRNPEKLVSFRDFTIGSSNKFNLVN